MIPIGDDNSNRTIRPYVNIAFIIINVFVYVFIQKLGTNEAFTMGFSTVPEEIITGQDIINNTLTRSPHPVYWELITSMFMHGSIMHLLGNMLYLWVFGDNIENAMGHGRYFVFYMLCGIIASLCHVAVSYFSDSGLMIPSLGASGAISGVLGAYLVLYPKNKVRVLLFMFVVTVPSIVVLGLWILLQVFSGLQSLGSESGGVAYSAHIGGFFAGMLLAKLFAYKDKRYQVGFNTQNSNSNRKFF